MPIDKTNIHIRPYHPEKDLAPLSAMLTEIEAIDADGEDTSEEALRQMLEWPNYHPDQDAWVAEYNETLVAYGAALGQPSQRCTIYVVVHPSMRRAQFGSQLLERTLHRARELGAKTILIYANEHNQASKSFLAKHEFLPVGSSGAMMATAGMEIPPVEFPAGFRLQPFSEVKDTFILASALNVCYLGMWGHQHNEKPSVDDPNVIRFLEHYGAENILLLFDKDNRISGICSVKPAAEKDEHDDPVDILDAPGLIHKYRGAGYQRQLVSAGIQHLREQARRPIKLEFWGDDSGTLSIYRRLCFEMRQHYIAYHKEIK